MERQIQRLENDIENFPKTNDGKDKFVEKMSISFFFFILVVIPGPCTGSDINLLSNNIRFEVY